MFKQPQTKVIINAATFGAFLLTLGIVLINPKAGSRDPQPFDFQSQINLPGWTLENSQVFQLPKLDNKAEEEMLMNRQLYGVVAGGYQYNYYQDKQQLNIKMLYVVGIVGQANNFIIDENNKVIQWHLQALETKTKEGIGEYGLFATKEKANLIACINPRGGSTVTSEGFLANKKKYDLKLNRLIPWLIGQESLRDRRCLWVHLSLPLNNSSPESLYPILEEAWFDWFQWWNNNFPAI